MNVYTESGYDDRDDYLRELALEYGEVVYALADLLGPSEDLDGLTIALEDMGL